MTKRLGLSSTGGYLADRLSSKQTALVVIIFVHVLVVRSWPHARQHQPDRVDGKSPLTIQLFYLQATKNTGTPPATKLDQKKIEAVSKRHNPRAMPPQAVFVASPAVVSMPSPQAKEPVVESTDAAINVEEMMRAAKRNIGNIDRELSKGRPKYPEAKVDSLQSRLERGISDAAFAQGERFEETTLSDNRRMTKVSRHGVVYCIYKENSGGLTGGRDMILDGPRNMVTTCPK